MVTRLVLKHLGDQDWSAVAYHENGHIAYSVARHGKGRAFRALGAYVSTGQFRRRRGSNTWERK